MTFEEVDSGSAGIRHEIKPLDPFGYIKSGLSDYPKELTAAHAGHEIHFRCHIWPGRSNLVEYRLPDGRPEHHQGLYFYRRNRLLQSGGSWCGITAPCRQLQLARVEIDIDDDIVSLFKMNPEKSHVQVGPEFGKLAEAARSADGTAFSNYLQAAMDKFRQSRQRNRSRKSVIPPGKGFAPQLRRVIANELPLLPGEKPIEVRWRRLNGDNFFDIDWENRTLWLNIRYRGQAAGDRHSVNDMPLIKALLYLLTQDTFRGEYLGARGKDNIDLWQEILSTAAKDEQHE